MAVELHEYSDTAVETQLSGNINAAAMSLTIDDDTGWPTGEGGTFRIKIDDGLATEEIIKCESNSGGTITVATDGRGENGTDAHDHEIGASVKFVYTAVDATEANQHAGNTDRDDHLQYLHLDIARTVSAGHHFTGDLQFSGDNDFAGENTFAAQTTFSLPPVMPMGLATQFKTLRPGMAASAGTSPRAMRADAQLELDELAIYRLANPVGKIMITAGNVADLDYPDEWLRADQGEGVTFDANEYPNLNDYLGGNTLPNYEGMALVGASSEHDVGEAFGQASVDITLSEANLAPHVHDKSHGHGVTDGGHHHPGPSPQQFITGSFPTSTEYLNAGSNVDHSPGWNVSATANTGDATTGVTVNSHSGNTGSAGDGDPFEVETVPPSKAVAVWIKAH